MMNKMKLISMVLAACLIHATAVRAQQRVDETGMNILHVRDNIYMLVGEGGNVTLQLGDDGVLIVDSQYAARTDRILSAVRNLTELPIRYIINTHYHPDHVGGNRDLRAAGSTISGGNISMDISNAGEGAQIIAHENVLLRLSAAAGTAPESDPKSWPTSPYFSESKSFYFNNEGVQVFHIPRAHTDGDSIVYFRKSDVIAAGDVYQTTTYPYIDLDAGGSYQGIIDGLNRLIDMMIPVYGQDDGTLVIPGHGRLSDIGDVINYREMLTIIGDRIKDMISRDMTLAAVKAAGPTRDYDPRWGATTGRWTTDMFIEAAYRSLGEKE